MATPTPEAPAKKNFFARHKILTALLAIIAVIILATTMNSKKDSTPSASSSKGSLKSSAAKAPAAGVGSTVKEGDLEFTVTKVVRDQATVGDAALPQRAQGKFTLVYVTVKNVGKSSQYFTDSEQKGVDTQGTQYSVDSGHSVFIPGNDVLFSQINPGNQVKGVLLFDAPAGTKLTQVILHDNSLLSDGAKVSLG